MDKQIAGNLLVEYGIKLLDSHLIEGTWGNLSINLGNGFMMTTPSGKDYRGLKTEDMVIVNIENLDHEPNKKPTSEKIFHSEIYKSRPDVSAIIHTHSKYASIFAAAHHSIEINNNNLINSIKCAKYAISGTKKLSRNIVKALSNNIGVLMANHGIVLVGADIDNAFKNAILVENYAKAYIENALK